MNTSDEIRKTLSDPKPLYALVGAGDLVAEKLKDTPDRLRDTPALLAEVSAALTTIANKLAAEAPERIAKITTTVQGAAGNAVHPDTEALRNTAQTVALQQVGRLLEAAGKAVETYDELAERGKNVVDRYTGGSQNVVPGESVGADDNGPVVVVVEQVIDEDEITDGPAPETAEEAAEVFEAAAEAEDEVEREAAAAKAAEEKAQEKTAAKKAAETPAKPKPAAAKKTTTSTPRKRAASSTTAPKTPRPPKA
jgi:hypothetical protein